MTRQEAIEKLRQHFKNNVSNHYSTMKGQTLTDKFETEFDVIDELNFWFDENLDNPSAVGEFIIEVLTKED